MPFKQSVCYPICKPAEMPLGTLFAEVARIGYPAVEMWNRGDDFAEVVALAKKHGLAIASMIGHGSLGDGLNNPANTDRIEAELRTSIDLAAKHRVRGVICFSGNRREGQSDADGIAATANTLARVAPYAESAGINLNLELLNSKIDHGGYQCDRTDWGIAVCERVGSPRVKLLYDIYHMQIMEGDVIRTIGKAARWIGHYHTAGVPGRAEIGDEQELNYRAIARAINATGYDGYVGHEFRPKGELFAGLREAFEIFDGCERGAR